ncbi:MAG: M3 family oligoendopeptidase [Phycisphaera sp.]|nr:M3 family oligoendopeptidase [Phycisphaera sp.]
MRPVPAYNLRMPETAEKPFVPDDFDPTDFANIEPFAKELLDRQVGSVEALNTWVHDAVALYEAIDEYDSRLHIDVSCHTDDAELEKAYMHWVREVEPKLKSMWFALQQKYLRHPGRHDLYEPGFAMMEMHWGADIQIYREENIPLQTRITELTNDYGKVCGAMSVEINGEELTLPMAGKLLEETDRDVRKTAFEAITARRLQDRQKIDDLFDEMLSLRQQVAHNAGFTDYRDYTWVARKRFDYRAEDCLAFGDAVEQHIVPVLRKVDEQRRDEMNLDAMRPWDTGVDVKGRPPLRPFDAKDIDGFVSKTREVFRRIDPRLGDWFWSLKEHGDLDLDSRKGKRPGGFQSSLEKSKRPFIFMNAAGTQRDVDTLLHEGGHAFHYLASRSEWNVFVRHAAIEFCEVASMSMELLGMDHYDVYYSDPGEAARAKRFQLEGSIRTMMWVATIDGFQHWIYTHPGHTAEHRTAAWLEICDRFTTGVIDWSGHEPGRASMWQRQLHLFHYPFYYIEYAIAQLGALQVWQNYVADPKAALTNLLEAFALGGTRPLPELFNTAGARFDFSAATIAPLIEAVEAELDKLPA